MVDYGFLTFNIETILNERGISKNKLCKELDIPRTNFNRYCRNRGCHGNGDSGISAKRV